MSIEETQELPTGWRWVKLGDLCEIFIGRTPRRDNPAFWGGRNLWVSIGDLCNGTINITKETITDEGVKASRSRLIKAGTLLFSFKLTIGKMSIAGQDMYTNEAIAGLIPYSDKEVTTEFLRFALSSIDAADGSSHAVKGKTLNQDSLVKMLIPVPPLPEQKRIAAILTEKMAAVEKARTAVEERLKAAKELPAAYLREVFESKEAQGWQRKRIEEIAELLPSKSIATDGDAEVQAITTACLSEVGFLPAGIKTARMKSSDVSQCIVSAGEILIARSNTPELVGRVAMFGGEPHGVVASDLTIRIMPNDLSNSEFITSYLSFLYLSGYWKDRAGGASGSMKKITRGQILAEKVPVLNTTEQQRIIMRLKDCTSGTNVLIKHLQEELAATKELSAALLRKAFTGNL